MKVCCFTGHRVLQNNHVLPLVRVIDRHIERLAACGVTEFRTGGALGFDTLAALRVLAAAERNPELHLSLILPCRDQTKFWRTGEKALFDDILAKADAVSYVTDVYTPRCMYTRNRALVDGSDLCIAYLTENRGGTLYTCTYALKHRVELLNLAEEIE